MKPMPMGDNERLKEHIPIPAEASDLEQKAMRFAFEKHSEADQTRKYSKKHYIIHPAAVAELVRSVGHTPEMLAAAWLHDTVEDTRTTLDDIQATFGRKVHDLVEMLTDISRKRDGNRRIRKEIDRQHLANASPAAKTVKLADLIHNSASIIRHDPGFARVYMREMRELLEVLEEGDQVLWQQASAIVREFERDELR